MDSTQTNRPAVSPRLLAIRASKDGAPKGRTEGFAATVSTFRYAEHPVADHEGLKLVKCRRCGGSGKYRTMRGMEACAGHGRCGVCVNGKSLGPKCRRELRRRQAQFRVDAYRSAWRGLAAMTPVTRWDYFELAQAMEFVERSGHAAVDYLSDVVSGAAPC